MTVEIVTEVEVGEGGDEKRSVRTSLHFNDEEGRSRTEKDGFVLFRDASGRALAVEGAGRTDHSRLPALVANVDPIGASSTQSSAVQDPASALPVGYRREELGRDTIRGVEVTGIRLIIERRAMPGVSDEPYVTEFDTWKDENGRVVRMKQSSSIASDYTVHDFLHFATAELPEVLFEIPASASVLELPSR